MSELKVDPAEIHTSGVEVGEIAARTRSAFADSDAAIASAQSGWVGRSAGALTSLAADWREATASYPKNLVEHGEKFVDAAEKYVQSDESGAASVRNAAPDIGTRSRS
jgi:WXG100 family type VII secretion target